MKNVRQQILDTAARLFYEQGYNNTGINQIIAEAGIAKASLYQHFASKEELCMAYLEHQATHWLQAMTTFLQGAAPGAGKVERLFDFLEHWLMEVAFRGCTFQNIVSEVTPAEKRIFGEAQRIKHMLRLFLQRIVARDPDAPDPEEQRLGDQLTILFEGAMIESQIAQELWPVRTARELALQLASTRS